MGPQPAPRLLPGWRPPRPSAHLPSIVGFPGSPHHSAALGTSQEHPTSIPTGALASWPHAPGSELGFLRSQLWCGGWTEVRTSVQGSGSEGRCCPLQRSCRWPGQGSVRVRRRHAEDHHPSLFRFARSRAVAGGCSRGAQTCLPGGAAVPESGGQRSGCWAFVMRGRAGSRVPVTPQHCRRLPGAGHMERQRT